MKKLYLPIITLLGISYTLSSQTYLTPRGEKFNTETSSKKQPSLSEYTELTFDRNEDGIQKSRNEKKGDAFFFIYSYDKAIEAYTAEEKLTTDGQRKLAISYYKMNKNTEAEAAYLKLFTMSEGNTSEDYFNYSMVLKASSKYEEAGKWMDKFNGAKPSDLRAIDYEANKSRLTRLVTENPQYKVQNLSINTDAEDFGTSYYKDKIVFASSRTTKANPKTSYRNGKPYLNIYIAEIDNDQLKNPENLNKSLNGNMNEGPASFSKDGSFMAYTKNEYDLTKKELIVNFEIYFSTFNKEKGEWSKPESFFLNNKDYSVGHPALSADGKTMYFTSNMPGGFGGADIYRVTREDNGTWGNSLNLGNSINTEGDEVFPFYQEKKGVLLFASNGRFGLGGLDIFSSAAKGSGFEKSINLGAPLNTSYDDFSIIMDSTLTKGYFSSNRSGGSGDDDIYSVKFNLNKKINGHALDKNKNLLASTFITLLNDKGDVLDTVTTKSDGAFSFSVETDKNFKLTGTKEKYNEGDNMFNTFGQELLVQSDVILTVHEKKEEVVVVKKEEPIAEKIKVNHDLGKIVGFKPIYFDYHEYAIRPFAEIELNKIVKAMNEFPEMAIALNSHTDCRASREYNQVLSEKRAKASMDYIKKRITHPERITGKGYGETKLINECSCDRLDTSNCTEEAHQENRRTEFIIVKK